jgi:prepilin-type processing-associated H-X9-DG protein
MEAFGELTMPDRGALTIPELFTLLISISLLITIVIGGALRQRHDEHMIVCAEHLRKLSLATIRYADNENGALPGAKGNGTDWWCCRLPSYLKSFKSTLLCPNASSAAAEVGNAFAAWTIPVRTSTSPTGGQGRAFISGSYGFNGYLAHARYANAAPMRPMFGDCIWYSARPHRTDIMPQNLFLGNADLNRDDQMGDFCISRHNGEINIAMLDGSVETVRLHRLWSLDWSGRTASQTAASR